jgi:DNA topoisomerase-1
VPRLKRVDSSSPGIRRRRRGRGFQYLDEDGAAVRDAGDLERIPALAIPPAWTDVWISAHPMGHIQATGTDDAGRKQYRYHERWRERRDAQKFENMILFARALPNLRRRITRDLARDGLPREKVLACAVRLLDVGFFRIGSEDYADQEENASYGLATIRKQHASIENGVVSFDYPAKGGQRRRQSVRDPAVCRIVAALRRRRGGSDELLAYRGEDGDWRDVRSEDINAYIKEITGGDFSANDLPHLERHRARGDLPGRAAGQGRVAHREEADDDRRLQGGGQAPRQHAGGVPGLLHRPAGVGPLRGRSDDQA